MNRSVWPARLPRYMLVLGYAGLLPFVAGCAGLWLAPVEHLPFLLQALNTYGAVILSFMAAIHWSIGLLSNRPEAAAFAAASVMPALLGWFALMIPAPGTVLLLAIGFVGVYVMDTRAITLTQLPRWYQQLRTPLTVVVVACLLLSLAALKLR